VGAVRTGSGIVAYAQIVQLGPASSIIEHFLIALAVLHKELEI
jgi:hypothetical protein